MATFVKLSKATLKRWVALEQKRLKMEKHIKRIDCILKDCPGTVETHWDNKDGFKSGRCSVCKTLFSVYVETRLRLIKGE